MTILNEEKEVEGARLQIQDEEGTVVEEWTSTNESHIIYALKPGVIKRKYPLNKIAGFNAVTATHFSFPFFHKDN